MSSTSAPPDSTTTIDELQQDALHEVFSHFQLPEVDKLRKVSTAFEEAAEKRKTYIYSLLKIGAKVEIVGLASAQGKPFNGRIGIIIGTRAEATGRFPVKILLLTGDSSSALYKAQNLNPIITDAQNAAEEKRMAMIGYTTDAKVRVPHGMFLDQIFMLNRWACNNMNGNAYFSGDF